MSQFAFGSPLGYQQINSGIVTATALTVPSGTTGAMFRCEGTGAAVRWRSDGTAPTASAGNLMLATDEPIYLQINTRVLQFIAAAGTPTLDVSYYGK
jgi:hypothetical protein